MTQAQKVIRAKVGLLELAKQLGNVSHAQHPLHPSAKDPQNARKPSATPRTSHSWLTESKKLRISASRM